MNAADPAAGGPEAPTQEIRLALVMNGGVSLAVWMGGVTLEIDRARRALADNEGPYTDLLNLFRCSVRTDVIAGTSAGGLNGCLLAAAVANGRNVASVRDVWLEVAAFPKILRSGWSANPPSLLNGDGYFLPSLETVFEQYCSPKQLIALHGATAEASNDHERRLSSKVHLMVPGTDLEGELVNHVDDFGGEVDDTEHRAIFTFRRDPHNPDEDDFVRGSIAKELALAARSSASFPGAFEPSFCRVADKDHPKRTDMTDAASFTSSRWVVDGGVLDNSPFEPVLDAIVQQRAETDVRRIVTYVVPYVSVPPDDDVSKTPPLVGVLGSASSLPRDLTLTNDLDNLEQLRRRMGDRRRRLRTLFALDEAVAEPMANNLLSIYREGRARAAVYSIVDQVRANEASGSRNGPVELRERTASIPVAAITRAVEESAPKLPVEPPASSAPWIPDSTDDGIEAGWAWGLSAARRCGEIVLDLVRTTLNSSRVEPSSNRAALLRARGELHDQMSALDKLHRDFLRGVVDTSGNLTPVDLSPGEMTLRRMLVARTVYADTVGDTPRDHVNDICDELLDIAEPALALLEFPAPDANSADVAGLTAVFEIARTATRLDVLRRLLLVETIDRAFTSEQSDPIAPFELLQLNAAAANAFDNRSTPSRKLAGLQLNHFGGFYKRSWRANDWMWGRLDGSSRLTEVLVSARRLRALGLDERDATASLVRLAFPQDRDDPTVSEMLRAGITRDLQTLGKVPWTGDPFVLTLDNPFLQEVTAALGDATTDAGERCELDLCRLAIRRRLQLEILQDEIPVVASNARVDVTEGASQLASGYAWACSQPDLEVGATPSAVDAVRAFRTCMIGEERIGDEVGADLLTRTASTAAIVAVSMFASRQSGLPRVGSAAVASVRGVFLALYALARGVASESAGLRAFTVLVVTIAGLVAGIWLFSDTVVNAAGATAAHALPTFVVTAAEVVIVGAILLALLRSGVWALVVVVGLTVATVAFLIYPYDGSVWGSVKHVAGDHPTEMLLLAFVIMTALLAVIQKGGILGRIAVDNRKNRTQAKLRRAIYPDPPADESVWLGGDVFPM